MSVKKICTSLCLLGSFSSVLLAVAPVKETPEILEAGKKLFGGTCVTCHGEKGDGNTPAGKALNPKPRNFLVDKFKNGDSVQNIFDSISKGLPGTAMTSYSFIAEEDRWKLAYYVKSLTKKNEKESGKENKKKKK